MLLLRHHPAAAFSLQRLDIHQGSQQFEQLIILDARPRSVWQQGHLPGAFSLSWEDYTRVDNDGVKYRILPPAVLAQRLGELGIGRHSRLLIYGDADSSWGGEGWLAWVLAWLGHQGPVFLLDGGIQAWTAAALPLSQASNITPTASIYEFELQPQLTISAEQLAEHGEQFTIIDTRNYWKEWLPGHLPGAVHIDWKNFYHGANRQPLDGAQLKALLIKNGVDPAKPVVYYCTGGIRSGFTWMTHTLAGLPAALNFEGGIEEWNHYQKQP